LLRQPTPLLEHFPAPIAADDMRQGSLDNFILETRPLAGPRLERRPESVRCQVIAPHSPQQHREGSKRRGLLVLLLVPIKRSH
jgi:hypothetical protein